VPWSLERDNTFIALNKICANGFEAQYLDYFFKLQNIGNVAKDAIVQNHRGYRGGVYPLDAYFTYADGRESEGDSDEG